MGDPGSGPAAPLVLKGAIMDIYMPMSTTARHNRLTGTFFGTILDLLRKREVYALHEECSLVYWGDKAEPTSLRLVDIAEIEDLVKFKDSVIEDLYYVQPDFMLFKNNPYIENKRQTRTAGCPDLIVEIWSEGNTKNDRAFLQNLYATSDITEHWYIEQDSNEVVCYTGRQKNASKCLNDILVTRGGLQFDLRYLAI
jgi:Uma2 family endonuclease